MIQPGMTFGSEGPLVQGTWVNPSTGDSFTVRDSFFEDNQYVVTTTDGRYIRYDQLQHYIQADPKSIDGIKQAATNNVKNEQLPLEVSSIIAGENEDMMTPEDYKLIQGQSVSLGNLNNSYNKDTSSTSVYTPTIMYTPTPMNAEKDMNTAIIEKALKNTDKPAFTINLDWINYPEKQIEMLHDIMSIDIDNIIDWYLDNIQLDDIISELKHSIKTKLVCKEGHSPVGYNDFAQQDSLILPGVGCEKNDKSKKSKKTSKK